MIATAIRDYQTADEEAVLRLLRAALGTGRAFDRTAAFWRWKHFENPFGTSLLLVATNGDVQGLRAFLRWRFRGATRTIYALRAVDTATHPEYRRHGVFSALTRRAVERARDEGVDVIFNTPNAVSLRGYLKLGWTLVGRPTLLIKPLRPRRLVRSLLGRDGAGSTPGVVRAPAVPAGQWLEHADVGEVLGADDRLRASQVRTERSAVFMRWRYASTSAPAYHACWVGDRAVPEAVAIFRMNRRQGLREVVLAEVLLRRGAGGVPAVMRRLQTAVDADYVVAYAPRGSIHWWGLVRAGFVPLPGTGPYFVVRPLSAEAAARALTRLAHWNLSLGDLELF